MIADIRAAKPVDAARLALIHAECFAQGWDLTAFVNLLEQPTNFALLAGEFEDVFSAFVLARVAADEAEILTLGTASAVRRKGFARALVRAAAHEAHNRGAMEMFLEVAADNGPALTLYRALGFVEMGRRPAYYPGLNGAFADALTLRASLPL